MKKVLILANNDVGLYKFRKELIEHLPQKEKDIIRMYLLEELSYEEMEACTGMKQGNLRQIVLRTRNKLKEQFTKIAQSWKN